MHCWLFSVLFLLSSGLMADATHDLLSNMFGKLAAPSSSVRDPSGFFEVQIPSQFNCQVAARDVGCKGTQPASALLKLEVKDVPLTATNPNIFSINQMNSYQDQPHFRIIKPIGKTTIDGQEASELIIAYDTLSNVQLPVRIQTDSVVKLGKLWQVTFTCFATDEVCNKQYGKPVADFLKNLHLARLDKNGKPLPLPAMGSTEGEGNPLNLLY